MKNIDYVIGSADLETSPLPVFNDEVCSLIESLSGGILNSPLAREYPDLSALAFWGRKANLNKLKADFGNLEGRIGRGLCLHIAPSNIPVNFAFSWLFSLLAGNANLVRLPSKAYPQAEALCKLIAELLEDYPKIKARTAFIRYERSDEITAELSKDADARMIWGGDETVKRMKAMPTSPRCVDISFPDRYSVLVIDANAVLDADDDLLKRLAQGFYNDTYLMDQNACSSPQLILWTNDCSEGRERFWKAVTGVADARYVLQDAVAVDKYTQLCCEAIQNQEFHEIRRTGNLLYREEISALNADTIERRGKGGYFYEYALKDLHEFCAFVTERFQTVTYFGLDPKDLRKFVIENCVNGVDRIVPVGKAMDIGTVWDGHDLIRELSRIIAVE